MECCSHVLAVERVADVLPELHELHLLHWQETEKYRHGLPFQPDYEAVLASERAGQVVQFTARQAGQMVGNLRVYLQTSRHTGTRFAKEDTLFVHPGHRGGWLAMHLLRYAETVLKGLGVREIRADSKLSNRADVLMRRMGYEPVSTQFVKFF